jgi:hypothetical protein
MVGFLFSRLVWSRVDGWVPIYQLSLVKSRWLGSYLSVKPGQE